MDALFGLLLMLAILAAQVPALRAFWLHDRPGFIWSVKLVAYYFLYCGIGIFAVMQLSDLEHRRLGTSPIPPARAGALTLFALCWILLGVSMLIKLAPRLRQVPGWIDRSLPLMDRAALAIMAGVLLFLYA